MARSILARGPFTEWLKDKLTLDGLLVGLGDAPDGGGWSSDPQSSYTSYTMYCSLLPRQGSVAESPLDDPESSWNLAYTVTSYGITSHQVEYQADKARKVVSEMPRDSVTLGGLTWRIMKTRCDSIGSVDVNKNIYPFEYSQTDIYIITLTQ